MAVGVYAVLKRLFRQAGKTAEVVGLDLRRFEKSSTTLDVGASVRSPSIKSMRNMKYKEARCR